MNNQSPKQSLNTSFITIGREKIRYFQKGKGKDLILIHGMPGSIEDWQEVLEPLSNKFRVTAFDRLGYGQSSANNCTYHIQDSAELVEQLIVSLALINPFIVGHSYGGSVVAYLAVNSSLENVNYMIVDSPLYDYKTELKFKLVALPFIGKFLAKFSSFTIAKSEIENGVSVLFCSFGKEKIDELVAQRQEIWANTKVIYSKSKESVNYGSDLRFLSQKYKNIQTKITIVTAKEFHGTYGADCKRFHDEVKNSKLIVFENTGHYIQLEKFDELVHVIVQNS